MTVLRSGAAAVHELRDADRAALGRLVDDEPIVNAVLASRLRAIDSLQPSRFGGRTLGVRHEEELTAAVFHGGNLLPVGGDADDWAALAYAVAAGSRECTSIVGRADAVHAFWTVLHKVWGPPRGIRVRQPLLLAERAPLVPTDPRVRAVELNEVEQYYTAAVAMFTEELGISPSLSAGTASYRRRIEWLIRSRRAFGIVDCDGRIAFKADIGAVTDHTCQVQGVWTRPDLRGQGLATAALAAVFEHALTLAPSVSLYVNDYNEPARRLYDRLGMRQVATLTTILL